MRQRTSRTLGPGVPPGPSPDFRRSNRPLGGRRPWSARLGGAYHEVDLEAGGDRSTPYPAEQEALGRSVPGAAARRGRVEEAVGRLREVWSGTVSDVSGFLRPEPPPPIVISGFGERMAALAGRVGDGINVPGGPGLARLIGIAREACEHSGRDPGDFLVTASGSERKRLEDAGVHRMIVHVRPPYVDGVRRASDDLGR